MTNEQTIDAIMAAVFESQEATAAYESACGPGTDEIEREMLSADHKVRSLIAAALAAKDAEISELLSEVRKCSDIALRLDAGQPDAPGAFTGAPSERINRAIERDAAEIERLKADAERYRWLKSRDVVNPTDGPDVSMWVDCYATGLRGEEADKAIDAAMDGA